MLEVCVRNLVDPRLSSIMDSSIKEITIIQNQISKGLNAVILKLSCSEKIRSGILMCAILDNLLLCIPERNNSVNIFWFLLFF